MKAFIDFIFGCRLGSEAVLIAKSGDGFLHAPWGSRVIDQWMHEGSCVYVNISTVQPTGTGEFMPRTSEACIACYVVVCDDVGTKVDEGSLPEPTYKLETSRGNFQWGYVLYEACEDLEYIGRLIDALADAGLTDPGARGFNRLVRVPGSLHKTGFKAVLRSRDEDLVFAVDDLAKLFGVDVPAAGRSSGGGASVKEYTVEDDTMIPFIGTVSGVRGDWLDVVCPWAHKHTTGELTAGFSPLGMGTGSYADARQFHCLHGHCASRGIREFEVAMVRRGWHNVDVVHCDNLPEDLAESTPPASRPSSLSDLLSRSVLVAGSSVCDVVALEGGSPSYDLRLADWNMQYQHLYLEVENGLDRLGDVKMKKIRPREVLTLSDDTRRAERYVVLPHVLGEEGYSVYMQDRGDWVVNTYAPVRHGLGRDDSYVFFVQHLQYLDDLLRRVTIAE